MSTSELLDSTKIVAEQNGERNSRRAFLVAAGAAGLCYAAALAYPIYRYLASPEEMALSATAVTEVTLKDAQKLPARSVLMFKFGTAGNADSPHGRTLDFEDGGLHAPGVRGALRAAGRPGSLRLPRRALTTPKPEPTSVDLRPSRSRSASVAVNDAGVVVSRA